MISNTEAYGEEGRGWYILSYNVLDIRPICEQEGSELVLTMSGRLCKRKIVLEYELFKCLGAITLYLFVMHLPFFSYFQTHF